ncbi:replication [Melbournevirus]|uniref:replication n=1 Tax=Melbournevirus TaxID=1560514 RepID=UPI00051F552D|nr:replication [Melbournevirus]AIT54776.1 helicase [Melbournevirus]
MHPPKGHQTQSTNDSSRSRYPKKYILSFDNAPETKRFYNGASECPMCNFREKLGFSLEQHWNTEEHRNRWESLVTKSQESHDSSVLWLISRGGEEDVLRKKQEILRYCGLIPPYLRVEWHPKRDVLFFYELPRTFQESRKNRISAGEKYLEGKGAQWFALRYGLRKGFDLCFVTTHEKTRMPMYSPFESIQNFETFYRTVPRRKRWFREMMLEGKPLKEVYDLETLEFAKGEVSEKRVYKLFCRARRAFGTEENLKIIPLKSSGEKEGKYKLSLRIFVNRIHKDVGALKGFVDVFRSWLEERPEYELLLKMLDFSIYTKNRQIRIVESAKYGESRYFELFDGWENEISFKDVFCSCHSSKWVDVGPKLPTLQRQPQKAEKAFVVQEDVEPLRFLLSGLSDERRKDYSKWCEVAFFIFGITKDLEVGAELLREFSMESDGYDERRFDEWISGSASRAVHHPHPVSLWNMRKKFREDNQENPSLLQKLDEELEKIGWAKPEFKTLEKEMFLPRANEILSFKEFVYGQIPEGKDALAIQSSLGTGKTKFVSMYLKENAGTQVILSYRKSLNRELMVKNSGFSLYSDFKDYKIRGCKKLVCSIDSIARMSGHYSVVVIDEFSETINQMMSVCREPMECFEILRELVQNADTVIVLDAFLTESSVQLLRNFGRKVHVVVNEHKAHVGKTCTILPSVEELCLAAQRSLKDGENIVVAMTSEKKLHVLCDMLEEEPGMEGKILRYTADTMNGEPVDASTWKNYRVVAYTSCITAGVSFEEKHFDRVFFYFTSLSCNVVDSIQMLFRVRNISSQNFVGVVNSRRENVPCSIESLKRRIEMDLCSGKRCLKIQNKKKEEKVVIPRGVRLRVLTDELEKNDFTLQYLQNALRNNLSKVWFVEQFFEYLKHQGMSLEEESVFCERRELEIIAKEMKECAVVNDEVECHNILVSEIITEEKHKEINSRGCANTQEKRSCQRYSLCKTFRVPPEKLCFDFIWNYRKFSQQFKNRCLVSGERGDVRKRLRNIIREGVRERRYLSLGERVLRSEKKNTEKVYLAWELLDGLGFSDFDLEKKTKHKDFMLTVDQEIRRVKEQERLYTHFFGCLTKTPIVWINRVLREAFGVSFGKTSRNSGCLWFLTSSFRTRDGEVEFTEEGMFIPQPEWIDRYVPVSSFDEEENLNI